MATFINVTLGGDALLRKDGQLRDASRFDALEKQKLKEAEDEVSITDTLNGEKIESLLHRRDPAAHRTARGGGWGTWYHESLNDVDDAVGLLRVAGSPDRCDSGTRRTRDEREFYVTSGDGTARATVNLKLELPAPPPVPPASSGPGYIQRTVGSTGSYSIDSNHWVLPAGNGTYIVVVMLAYVATAYTTTATYFAEPADPERPNRLLIKVDEPYSAPVVTSQAGAKNYVFACSHTKVRSLSIPPTMQALLDHFNPAPIEADATLSTAITGGVTTAYKRPQLAGQKSYAVDGANQTFRTEYGTSWDPSIYWSLNNEYQFIDPAQVVSPGTWRLTHKPAVSRNDAGGFKQMNDNSWNLEAYYKASQPLPIMFGKWKAAGNPILSQPGNIEPISGKAGESKLSPSRQGLTPPAPFPGLYYVDYDAVWDWDDPAYCKKMLTALGFTPAQLKP